MESFSHRRKIRRNPSATAPRLPTQVKIEKPLRIDLAGGWSDTPPICNEMGGCVLNAAVTISDGMPVRVKIKRICTAEVRISSSILGSAVVEALDPGSTNPMVESIIARIAPMIDAVTLCGAGGGGFMLIIASNRAAKRKIVAVLEKDPPVSSGRFYDLSLVL